MATEGDDAESLRSTAAANILEILSFLNLPDNWDTYGAEAPSAATVQEANLAIAGFDAQDVHIDHVAPNASGSIDLILALNTREVEISINAEEWQIVVGGAAGEDIALDLSTSPRNVGRVLELAV